MMHSPLTPEFDALVHVLLKKWHVPGMSVAVIDGSRTFSKGYGIAEYPDTKTTPDTLFYMASTTKAFTAAAMSLVINDSNNHYGENNTRMATTAGQIHWRTPLASIIRDDFVLEDEYTTAQITIEDALSHRSGIPDHIRHYGGTGASPGSIKDAVRILRYLPATAELRTKYIYNNLMYTAVSHAIETLTGENLGTFLLHRVWTPLHMASTYWTRDDAQAGDNILAQGYTWNANKSEYTPEPYPDIIGGSGAGAMISSVVDYARWIRCMMTCSGPLSKNAHAALIQPRTIIAEDPTNMFPGTHLYALGWTRDSYHGEDIIWHDGSVAGYGCTMMYLPRRQWGLVMAGNTTLTSNIVQVVLYMHLLDQVLGIPSHDRVDWQQQISERIATWREKQAHAKDLLYPGLPVVQIPPTLGVWEYAGLYKHPGYGRLELRVDIDGFGLVADRLTCEVPIVILMEHVSGEFWLASLRERNQDPRDNERVRAEFRIGVNGLVSEVGIDLEPEMSGEKIWFQRTDLDM
ncbi:beta-lactamase/transpeptidase-like protein [Aspergillus pseudonomiae]|uniref:Beta-lactamase/transpeptidase-like protein n=1 Tax=Aspergillus pseudonomiae TaxID=1506151 RepID=A0A5N6HWN1_9EURO|nr:beta-lactamase/transpeptidase-like protein [Aspergillus pseudonomiae]KAB8258845.1 beta-lactamase/transpeptidase-like protein [Aspergillus pseudonomiae]KAE8403533.1 beta-lactamase/transpeptidase-like protein [Aspergillus pseudonomiae]